MSNPMNGKMIGIVSAGAFVQLAYLAYAVFEAENFASLVGIGAMISVAIIVIFAILIGKQEGGNSAPQVFLVQLAAGGSLNDRISGAREDSLER